MSRHTTLLRAALLAIVFAVPSATLAEGPTEEVAFYYNRIAFQYRHTSDQAPEAAARSQSTPLLTPIAPLPATVHGGGSETVRKGGWILDTSPAGPAAARASTPKASVVVGPKLPTGGGAAEDLRSIKLQVDRNVQQRQVVR